MDVYSEEELQFAALTAGYGITKNGNPSRLVSARLCAEMSAKAQRLWNNTLVQMTRWVIGSLGLYVPAEMLRGNLSWQGFAGGLQGPAVDKQSFNSWWSGPLRGQRSPLLKPLVWHCLSTRSPCWLHKAEVLCDRLQALLLCFVLSVLLLLTHAFFFFFLYFHGTADFFGGNLRGIWSYPDFSLLHSALRFGWRPALSAFSRAHSHPRHAQIPVSRARLHFAEPDDCGWKMNYSAGFCLTDRASCDCTRVKEAVRKRSVWPCLNYLAVFPFVVGRLSQDGKSCQCPWATQTMGP